MWLKTDIKDMTWFKWGLFPIKDRLLTVSWQTCYLSLYLCFCDELGLLQCVKMLTFQLDFGMWTKLHRSKSGKWGRWGAKVKSVWTKKKPCMLGWHTMAFWQAVLVVSTECVTSAASGHYSKTQCLQSHSGWHIHSPRYHDRWKNKHKGSTPTVWLLTFHAAFWLSVHSLQLSFIYVTPNHSGRCLKEIYVVR